jgi:uncharacterized membrane protein YphA (DoxX/SURF4 family)
LKPNELTGAKRFREITWSVGLITALRVSLGALFIISSVSKLQYPDLFIEAVQKYGILPEGLAHVFGTVVPWAELFIGCSLILGIFTTLVAGITAALVFSFIVANIYSLFGPYSGEPCECLGRLVRLSHPVALVIDFAMLSVAGLLLFMRDKSEVIGLGRLLRKDVLRLPKAGLFALGVFAIGVAMMVSFFLIPSPKGALELQIDEALENDRGVVLLFLQGDPTNYMDEIGMIARLREDYSLSVFFRSVDCDEEPEALQLFDVETYPTILVVSDKTGDGYVVYGRFGGAEDRDALVTCIEELLASKQ